MCQWLATWGSLCCCVGLVSFWRTYLFIFPQVLRCTQFFLFADIFDNHFDNHEFLLYRVFLSGSHWLLTSFCSMGSGYAGFSHTAPVDWRTDRPADYRPAEKNGNFCVQPAQCSASCLWLASQHKLTSTDLSPARSKYWWKRCVHFSTGPCSSSQINMIMRPCSSCYKYRQIPVSRFSNSLTFSDPAHENVIPRVSNSLRCCLLGWFRIQLNLTTLDIFERCIHYCERFQLTSS